MSGNLRSLGIMPKNILVKTLVLLLCMLPVLNNTVSLRIFNLISSKVKLVFLLNFLAKPIPFLLTLATILWLYSVLTGSLGLLGAMLKKPELARL